MPARSAHTGDGASHAQERAGAHRWSNPLPLPVTATMVLETGVQNTVIALAIAALTSASWPADEAFRLQLLPIAWGLFVSAEAAIVMLIFRYLIRKQQQKAPSDDSSVIEAVVKK